MDGQGAGGRVWDSVGFANRGLTPCWRGDPVAAELLGPDGDRVPLQARPGPMGKSIVLPPTNALFDAHVAYPAGGLVTLTWGTWLDTCPSKTFIPFAGVRLTFEDGGPPVDVALSGQHSACAELGVGVSGTNTMGPYVWSEYTGPAPSARASLLTELSDVAPDASGRHSYLVRVTNQGTAAVPPAAYCKPFTHVFQPTVSTPGGSTSRPSFAQRVELAGCETVRALPPGETAELEIRFDAPIDAQGSYQLLWLPEGFEDPYSNAGKQIRLP